MIWWPTTLLVDTVRDTLPGSVLAPQIQVEYLLAQLEGAIKLRMQEIDGRGGIWFLPPFRNGNRRDQGRTGMCFWIQ